MYYTYMLRCTDDSIYTGITTDLKRRMDEHFTQGEKCAKYTKRHKAKKLEAAWSSEDRKLASKLEYYIKAEDEEDYKLKETKTDDTEYIFERRIEITSY